MAVLLRFAPVARNPVPSPQDLHMEAGSSPSDGQFSIKAYEDDLTHHCVEQSFLDLVNKKHAFSIDSSSYDPPSRTVDMENTTFRFPQHAHSPTSSSSSLYSQEALSLYSSQDASSSFSCGLAASKISRQQRRKAGYFTKIKIGQAGEIEERYVYASHHVSSSTLLESSYEESTGECASPSVTSPSKEIARRISLKSKDSLISAVHLATGEAEVAVEEFDELADEWDDDEDVVDEQDVWSRPGSSISVRSDPFEYSFYLSEPQPACHQRADSEPVEKTNQSQLDHWDCDPPRSAFRRASFTDVRAAGKIPPAIESTTHFGKPLTPMSSTPVGPSENVLEALHALRSIQARESSLFGDLTEEN